MYDIWMKSDHLFIEDLEISCRVGTTAKERAFPQVIRLSIDIELPLEKAGVSDDLRYSVDYAMIIADIKSILKSREFQLIETVAEIAAKTTLKYRGVRAVSVRAGKKVFADVKSVGAYIHRKKR